MWLFSKRSILIKPLVGRMTVLLCLVSLLSLIMLVVKLSFHPRHQTRYSFCLEAEHTCYTMDDVPFRAYDRNYRMKPDGDKKVAWKRQSELNEHASVFPGLEYYELLHLPEMIPSKKATIPATTSVTVILNIWKRPYSFTNQLLSIVSQSHQPAAIWVCAFGTLGVTRFYEPVLHEFQHKFQHIDFQLFRSAHNLGYYGRFQVALGVASAYTWVVDDDIVPGIHFLAGMVRTIRTRQYRGVLGSIGWILPPPAYPFKEVPQSESRTNGSSSSSESEASSEPRLQAPENFNNSLPFYLQHGVYFPETWLGVAHSQILPADFLCSQWFFETSWIRTLFREAPLTKETAEDFFLSRNVRKYLDLPSFVMPVDRNNLDTWGDTDHRLSWHDGTTFGAVDDVRQRIFGHYLMHGASHAWGPMWKKRGASLATDLFIITGEDNERAAVARVLSSSSSSSNSAEAGESSLDRSRMPAFVGYRITEDSLTSWLSPLNEEHKWFLHVDSCHANCAGLFLLTPGDGATDGLAESAYSLKEMVLTAFPSRVYLSTAISEADRTMLSSTVEALLEERFNNGLFSTKVSFEAMPVS
eukprot:ANDGO_03018.mRNA.1 hypothetical protein